MCGGLESGNASKDAVEGIIRIELSNGRVVWVSKKIFDTTSNELDLVKLISQQIEKAKVKWEISGK